MNGKLGIVLILISFLTGIVSLALSYFGLPALLFGPICAVIGCLVFTKFFKFSENLEQVSQLSSKSKNDVFEEGLILGFKVSAKGEGVLIREDGNVLYTSKGFAELIGQNAGNNIRGWPYQIFEQVEEIFELAKSGKVEDQKFILLGERSEIDRLPIRIIENPFTGNIIFAISFEFNKVQGKYEIDTLSRFSSGVAHDLNNLLSSIVGSLSLLERQTQTTMQQRQLQLLHNIRNAAKRGTRLSQDLLNFGKAIRSSNSNDNVHLYSLFNTITDTALSDIQSEKYKIECVAETNLFVKATEDGLHQVIINLIYNSIDAMPDGGIINVKTFRLNEGKICIEVIDRGVGIPSDIINNIFEPFYSTKKAAKPGTYLGGSGLGLANVKALVISWGGEVSCESEIGKGTKFTIILNSAEERNQEALFH
jgi:signal transduction histidine kinase